MNSRTRQGVLSTFAKVSIYFPGLIWWIAFYPGIVDHDAKLTLSQLENLSFTTHQTITWMCWAWLTSIGGNWLPGITLASLLLLPYSLRQLLKNFTSENKVNFTVFFLMATPIFGGAASHIWHDSTSAIGILLLSSLILRTKHFSTLLPADWALAFISVFLISTRHNGIPSLLIYLVIVFVFSIKRRSKRTNVLFVIASSLSVMFIMPLFFGFKSPSTPAFSLSNFVADINCVTHREPTIVPADFWVILEKMAPKQNWTDLNSCKTANQIFYENPFNYSAINENPQDLLKVWNGLMSLRPNYILEGRLMRADSFIPPPFQGIPERMYILDIWSPNNQETIFKTITRVAILLMTINVYFAPVLGWSGFWLLISIIFLFAISWRQRRPDLLGLGLWMLIIQTILILNTQGPDARYAFHILWIGQCAVVISVLYIFDLIREHYISEKND
jgi:hypothetical protein